MDTKTAWQTLRDYAEGRIGHTYAGSCPDHVEGHDSRDAECLVCQALEAVAGAAPAAVTPLPAVLEQIAQGWDGCKYDAPGETLDIGADIRAAAARLLAEQPEAVAIPGSIPKELTRLADIMRDCGRLVSTSGNAEQILRTAATLLSAPTAPALEAPAAPSGDEEAAFTKWFQGEQGKPYQGMWEFARAAWMARAAAPQAPAAPREFQQRVHPWLMECFGPAISADKQERNHRFLEEALETVQAGGCTASEAHQLVDYVFGRPVGELGQEVGGAMTTLAALCLANGIDMHAEAEKELARVWTMVEKIRAKQAAKPKHSPLPAAPAAPAVGAPVKVLSQAARDVLADYQGPDDTPHPVLLALSEHDSPCDDTAEAIARIAALRAEIEHLRPFQWRAQAHQEAEADRLAAEGVVRPSATTLNVLRVALERADMPRRATGFMDHEIATAVEWVRAAIAAQAAAKGEHGHD